MRPAKTPSAYAPCWRTRTARDLLLSGGTDRAFGRRGGAALGNKAVGQLPLVAIFLPHVHNKKLSARRAALVHGVLTPLKLHHHCISQVHRQQFPDGE